jgi:hypothetical protein
MGVPENVILAAYPEVLQALGCDLISLARNFQIFDSGVRLEKY